MIGGAITRIFSVGAVLAGVLHPVPAASVPLASAPSAPFHECPVVGADTSCGTLIVINPNSSVTVLNDPSQGPYDGADDTLVGVLNNSGGTVNSVNLSSSTGAPVFGFDGDGLCAFSFTGDAGCPFGPRGYEGPGTSFSNISPDGTSGTVNFGVSPGSSSCGGLAPGATAYFTLEQAINGSTGLRSSTPHEGGQASVAVINNGAPVVGAGPVNTTTPGTTSNTLVALPSLGLLTGRALSASVTAQLAGSVATAGVAQLAVAVPGDPISVDALSAQSSSTCGTHAGFVHIGHLQVGTFVVNQLDPKPNTVYRLGTLATLTLNQQVPTPNGLTVNAVDLKVPVLGLNVIVGSATSFVTPPA